MGLFYLFFKQKNMTTIEQLTKETDEIKSSLEELKNNVSISESEKKEKAKELKTRVETTRQKIQSEIDVLSSKTDDVSKKEKEEAEALLNTFNESLKLYEDILNSPDVKSSDKKKSTSTAEEKWFFWEIWDWIWTQWKKMWNKEEWEKNKWENILRTAVTVGWIAWIWIWIKKLFSKEDREERKKRRKERREARRKARAATPFRQRPIWKVLKWTWIWTIVYFVAHWVFTWDWLEDVTKRWTAKTEKAKDQVKKYSELSPEDKEKYESIGNNVNEFYSNVWKNEISYGYESPYDLGTISKNVAKEEWFENAEVYKWLVPFCMDDSLRDIRELLSEKNFTTYLYDKHATQNMEKIKWWITGGLGNVLWKFLSSLKSFEVFSKTAGNLSDKVEKWLNEDEAKRESRLDELNFFFRQYTKVLTYMKDKERSIAYMIAEEKCSAEESWRSWYSERYKNKYIQNKLSDNKWFDEKIETDIRYQNFMNSKILNSAGVLKNIGIFDWEMSAIIKKWIVDPIDNEFKNVMLVDDDEDEENTTIIDKWIEELNNWDGLGICNVTENQLLKMCDDLTADMTEEEWWLLKAFVWTQYALNTEESNMRKFLEDTKLNEFVDKIKGQISTYRTKIDKKTITEDELKKLKELTLAYFAYQKEVAIATYTFTSIRHDNPDILRRLIESNIMWFNNFLDRLNKIFEWEGSFEDWAVVGVWLGQWAIIFFRKQAVEIMMKAGNKVWNGAKWTVKHSLDPVIWVAWRPVFSDIWFQNAMKWISNSAQRESYFLDFALNWKNQNERFMVDLAKEDKANGGLWIKVKDATTWKMRAPNDMGEVFEELLKTEWISKADGDILWKYAWNSDIKKIVITQTNTAWMADRVSSWFKHIWDKFSVDKVALQKLSDLDASIDAFKWAWYPNSGKFMQDMINGSIRKAGDLDTLTDIMNRMLTDPKFCSLIEKGSVNFKVTRNSLKHIDNIRTSCILSEIEREIANVNTNLTTARSAKKTKSLTDQLSDLEDFKKSFITMSPQKFDKMDDFIKILEKNWGDVCGHVKTIRKIFEEWIEVIEGWIPKHKDFTPDDIADIMKDTSKLDEFEKCLKGADDAPWTATTEWRKAAGLASDTKVTKFAWKLKDITVSKKFLSNIDDYVDAMRRAAKIMGKVM